VSVAARTRQMLLLVIGGLAVVPLGVVMMRAITELPDEANGLVMTIEERMPDAGVSHAVTGVLLNFRAYDTWLEVVVLLVVATVTLGLRRQVLPMPSAGANAITVGLVRRLLPLLLLVAVFVLAIGTSGPGGAFQSGALFAAGGLLLFLAGYPITRLVGGGLLRGLLIAGTVAFLMAGLAGIVVGARALEFAPEVAAASILIIEITVTVSIVVTLVVLLVGAAPEVDD